MPISKRMDSSLILSKLRETGSIFLRQENLKSSSPSLSLLPKTLEELKEAILASPGSVVVEYDMGEVFTLERLGQVLQFHDSPPLDSQLVGPKSSFGALRDTYDCHLLASLLDLRPQALDSLLISPAEVIDDALSLYPEDSLTYLEDFGVPCWLTFNSETLNKPAAVATTPGVLLAPKKYAYAPVGMRFESSLWRGFINQHNLADKKSLFMAFDSSVVPAGMLGPNFRFIASEAPEASAKIMLMIADNNRPSEEDLNHYWDQSFGAFQELESSRQKADSLKVLEKAISTHAALAERS